jgi:hypothetical protein
MSVEAQRLYQWANTYGTPQQKEFASNMLKACAHSVQVFNPATTLRDAQSPSKPTPAVSPEHKSDAYIIGMRTAEMDRMRGFTSLAPYDPDTQQKQVSDWIAGYNDYTPTNPQLPE